jgi:hypothetical protein
LGHDPGNGFAAHPETMPPLLQRTVLDFLIHPQRVLTLDYMPVLCRYRHCEKGAVAMQTRTRTARDEQWDDHDPVYCEICGKECNADFAITDDFFNYCGTFCYEFAQGMEEARQEGWIDD